MADETVSEGFGEVEEREPEESTEETSENVGAGSTEEIETETEEETPKPETQETEEEKQPELTEKGTKLDENPQSALHQQLANEKRVRADMEKVLGNPEYLTKFLKQQYGVDVVQAKAEEVAAPSENKKYTAADFDTLDQVAEKFNELQSGFDQKSKAYEDNIKQLASTVSALVEGGREAQIATGMEQDASSLRSVPELKAGDPEFIDGLESKIVEKYIQSDFDPQTGRFRGQTTLKRVGDEFIEAIRLGRKSGSQKAQTIVRDKTEGRVRTSTPVKDEQDTSTMKPGDSIAAGIKRLGLR